MNEMSDRERLCAVCFVNTKKSIKKIDLFIEPFEEQN